MLDKLEKIRAAEARHRSAGGSRDQVDGNGYRMQTEAPEVFDIRKESQATLDMYGPGDQWRAAR